MSCRKSVFSKVLHCENLDKSQQKITEKTLKTVCKIRVKQRTLRCVAKLSLLHVSVLFTFYLLFIEVPSFTLMFSNWIEATLF